eukprot:TRINITY_DN122599_c0_g1_i1.p1 TRINITY_DN122599_c0_g1~~TRINITY_DN122599_c0_g1_i1.p1  ORF type:complete len:321 (-),score=97.02 TRINITY_DN122599_c0_g1_i1:76-1038(-)
MAGDFGDATTIGVIVAVFAAAVGAAFVFWPFPKQPLLDKKRKQVTILDIEDVSHDVKRVRLSNGGKGVPLGLPTGKHIKLYCPNPSGCVSSGKWNGRDDPDKGAKEIARSYTPTAVNDKSGYFDLMVKIYTPGTVTMPDGKKTDWADGGKMSLFLKEKKAGDTLDVMGPVGLVEYLGRGLFKIPGNPTAEAKHVGMLAGGSGITPMYQIVMAALEDKSDKTQFSLIYANKTEDDILCKDLLDEAAASSGGRFKVHYTLDYPADGWKGFKGFITEGMIKECLPAAATTPLMLMCGPPPMIEFACKKNLESLGYPKNRMVSF